LTRIQERGILVATARKSIDVEGVFNLAITPGQAADFLAEGGSSPGVLRVINRRERGDRET